MRSLGAVVLGISTYGYPPEAEYAPPLQFAVADADAIVGYLRTCWPDEKDAVVRPIGESAADMKAFEAAFAEVAGSGPYDLFLVYLAGHGLVSAPKSGFVLQPDPGGGPGLVT